MAEKKQPVRMCSGCGARRPKRELARIVRSPDGVITLDATGRSPGRGTYICRAAECLKKARKARRLERALSSQIPDDIYESLLKELNQG